MIRIFKHYIPRSLVFLAIAEFFIFNFAIHWGTSLRFFEDSVAHPSLYTTGFVFAAVMMSSLTAMGLYQRHLRDGRRGMLMRFGWAFLAAFIIMSLLFYLFPGLFLGRGAFGLAMLLAAVGVAISRLLFFALSDKEALKRRILVVGAGKNAALIERTLKRKTDRRGFTIVGYVALDGEQTAIADSSKLIRHDHLILDIAEQLDVDELVLALTDRRKVFPVNEIFDCKMNGIEVVELISFLERQTGRVFLELLHPSWMIFSDGFSRGPVRRFLKRGFDIGASLGLLILTFPIILLTMAAIKLDDGGPVFYRQIRVGRNWRLIPVLKFRSMRVDAEKNGAQYARPDDDRVTRVGRFIRTTRIDELPQLINVLKGEMSFVGPRPERPEFVEIYSKEIPYYAERHRVKPGITGWAQICYPYGSSKRDTIEKLQYDLYYVKNYSLFLDLTILFQTAEVILWGKGAR